MAFIKVANTVLNTNYIAAIKLESQTRAGERSISILIVAPRFPFLQIESTFPNACSYEWLDFTGQAAVVLQDYFSSFNNVIDLLPQHQSK
jgi:hypothetical protein